MTSYRVIEQSAAGENQLEIEINIDGADTGSWFTAPVTEGFLIFGFALLLAGKFWWKSVLWTILLMVYKLGIIIYDQAWV